MNGIPSQKLWWLHPGTLFTLVVGVTVGLALYQSEQNYALYNTPKYLNNHHGILALGAIITFALGCNLAIYTGKAPCPVKAESLTFLRSFFLLLTGLTLFGYLAMAAIGVKNGFSLSLVRELFMGSDIEVTASISTEIFQNVSGITTCTQFGIAAAPLGTWLYLRGDRALIWPLAVLFGAAFVRAFVLSERIALVELIIPSGIVFVRQLLVARKLSLTVVFLLQFAPFLAVIGLFFFFGCAEYLRSWKHYQKDFDSVVEFTLWRLSGYYTTAHNNGAMALETHGGFVLPYLTIQSLWEFPGVSAMPFGYANLTGISPDDQHLYMLERFGTEELNNGGGLFQPALDFGELGFLVFWSFLGYFSGKLYRCYMLGSLAGITLFPIFFMAIMEVPRFLYLSNQRAFPALIAIAALIAIVSRNLSKERNLTTQSI